MPAFSYQRNRIINGICEYCGVPAINCEHYKNGAQQPLDEQTKLQMSEGAPAKIEVFVEPLTEAEIAKIPQEAKEKMDAVTAELQQAEVAQEVVTDKKTGRGKSKK